MEQVKLEQNYIKAEEKYSREEILEIKAVWQEFCIAFEACNDVLEEISNLYVEIAETLEMNENQKLPYELLDSRYRELEGKRVLLRECANQIKTDQSLHNNKEKNNKQPFMKGGRAI